MSERQEPLVVAGAEPQEQLPPPAPTGVRAELLRLAAGSSGLLATRLELARLEFQEAQQNIQKRLMWAILALTFIGMAFLAGNVLLLATYWHTPLRNQILWWLIGGYVVLGLFALWRLSAAKRRSAALFAATVAEFEKDRQWFEDTQKVSVPPTDETPEQEQ